MNTRFCFLLKVCLLVLLATPAFAIESSQAMWTGFYAGADIGGTQSNIDMQTSVAPGGTYFNYTQDAPQVAVTGKNNTSPQNFSGGFFGGYAHQFGHIVLGAEASVNSLSINDSHSASDIFISDPNIRYVVKQSLETNWQEALRLKLGFAQQHWLAYLTGGTAMTSIKYTSSYDDDNSQPGLGLPGASGTDTTSETQFGWTTGGGVAYAFNNAWSIRVEYLYSDFGDVHTHYPIIPTPTLSEFSSSMDAKADLTVQSLLLGLTYRF